MKKIDYASSGVDYAIADPAKIYAQKLAFSTKKNLDSHYEEVSQSRGESSYVIDMRSYYLAFVQEGLGSKNLVADEIYRLTGKSYYREIAQDTVAAIINDLITSGASPLALNAYWSMHTYEWFNDKKRTRDFMNGWKDACDRAHVVWAGGETQSLPDIIRRGRIEMAGSAVGIIKPKKRLITENNLREGDRIVLFESSGIHSNGLTLARKIAKRLPDAFLTKVGRKTYGQHLLNPSIIYSQLMQDLFMNDVKIHYMVHVTGHGWRKLMRSKREFTYKITAIPTVPEVFSFIQKTLNYSDKKMYATFNMGAGFGVFISKKDAAKVIKIARTHGIKAYDAGIVEKGKKQIIIEPINVVFEEKELNLRV